MLMERKVQQRLLSYSARSGLEQPSSRGFRSWPAQQGNDTTLPAFTVITPDPNHHQSTVLSSIESSAISSPNTSTTGRGLSEDVDAARSGTRLPRATQVCDRCKKRKTKRALPPGEPESLDATCAKCRETGIDCQWTEAQQQESKRLNAKRHKEAPTSSPPSDDDDDLGSSDSYHPFRELQMTLVNNEGDAALQASSRSVSDHQSRCKNDACVCSNQEIGLMNQHTEEAYESDRSRQVNRILLSHCSEPLDASEHSGQRWEERREHTRQGKGQRSSQALGSTNKASLQTTQGSTNFPDWAESIEAVGAHDTSGGLVSAQSRGEYQTSHAARPAPLPSGQCWEGQSWQYQYQQNQYQQNQYQLYGPDAQPSYRRPMFNSYIDQAFNASQSSAGYGNYGMYHSF